MDLFLPPQPNAGLLDFVIVPQRGGGALALSISPQAKRHGAIPITMGGDGAISLPPMRAVARQHRGLVAQMAHEAVILLCRRLGLDGDGLAA